MHQHRDGATGTDRPISASASEQTRGNSFDIAKDFRRQYSTPVTQHSLELADAQLDALRRPRNEDEYKVWLENNFRHYFEPFEAAGGIPTPQMLQILGEDPNAEQLRQGKLHRLMRNMDANMDGRISWQEFFSKVTITRRQDLSRSQRLIVSVIRATVPAVERHKKQSLRADGTDRLDGFEDEKDYETYLEAYNCRPPPIFIPACCLAQIICFIVYAVELNNKGDPTNMVSWTTGVPGYSPMVFDPQKKKEAWRFISYMLLHCGYHHILFNLVIQVALGIPLELVHKAWRVGPSFLAGVLGGSVCSAVFDHRTQLVGASGGCYALMGAHIALVVMNWEELQKDWLKCYQSTRYGGGFSSMLNFLLSGVMRLIVLVLLIVLDFGLALYQRYGLNEDNRVSFLAHVGGLIFGFLVGIPVLKNLDKKPWEAYMFWICLIIGVCLMVAAMLYLCITDLHNTY